MTVERGVGNTPARALHRDGCAGRRPRGRGRARLPRIADAGAASTTGGDAPPRSRVRRCRNLLNVPAPCAVDALQSFAEAARSAVRPDGPYSHSRRCGP